MELAKRTRGNHTATFNVKVALEAAKKDKAITSEIAEVYDVKPKPIIQWKKQQLGQV